MKSQIAFLIVASSMIIAAVAVAASPFVYPAQLTSPPEYDFTLTATGQASDTGPRSVTLSISGTARGSLTKLMILSVESGTINVDSDECSVLGLQGILIQPRHYIHLVVKITPSYGGGIAVWNLRGTTGDWQYDNTLSVSLSSHQIILPPPYKTKLYGLTLTGTITLD